LETFWRGRCRASFSLLADKTEVTGGITISWLSPEADADVVPADDMKRLPPAKDPRLTGEPTP
jgi:hypothetical protein